MVTPAQRQLRTHFFVCRMKAGFCQVEMFWQYPVIKNTPNEPYDYKNKPVQNTYKRNVWQEKFKVILAAPAYPRLSTVPRHKKV